MKKKISLLLASLLIIITLTTNAATLYAPDGRSAEVKDEQVNSYLNLGWFKNYSDVTTTLYAKDGRTAIVYNAQVDTYLNCGWYKEPYHTMYAEDGRTFQCLVTEIDLYKSVGWYENYEDILVDMFSNDGRVITVFKSEVEAYKNVGWYVRDLAYFQSKPYFADYCDQYINGNIYMQMTYQEFCSLYGDKIISKSSLVQDVLYDDSYFFEVYLPQAKFSFMSPVGRANDLYSYTLRHAEITGSSYKFGRDINVGDNAFEIYNVLPTPSIIRFNYTDYNYLFTSNLERVTDAEYSTSYYAMTERLGEISIFLGIPNSGAGVHNMRIRLKDGIVTSILLS